MRPRILLTATLILVFCTSQLNAQTLIEVGMGVLVNGPGQNPSPYANMQAGGRTQMLIPASELQAAGMSAGTISSIGFNVMTASGATLLGYSIKLGTTSANQLTLTWEPGLTTVWGPQDLTDGAGWTQHIFDTPFFWDGVQNLVIETCYFNGTASQNARVFQTSTAYTSTVVRNSPQPTICTNDAGTHIAAQQRPNMRFEWTVFDQPPVAAFTNSAVDCSGNITFTSTSTNLPSSWEWDFGDGGTSNEANPSHTYASSGAYTVTLVVGNAFGTDTTETEITVDLDAPQPIAACTAPSSGTVVGFGIMNVTIEGLSHPSGDAASEGYQDHTCTTISILQGTALDLSVTTGNNASHALRGWVDWDNSGSFTANELLLSGTGPLVNSSTLIPTGAILNTPLRVRVIAAYDLVTPNPPACGTIQYGQAEDYSIAILENTQPPIAAFTSAPSFSCDGAVQFTDISLNAPTAWTWDFGDSGSSNDQSPMHAYTASGSYTVTLTAINANGENILTVVDAITIDLGAQLIPASCVPSTQNYCCEYGITGFQFAGISSTSVDASEGYKDRSCGDLASVEEVLSYNWSVQHSGDNPQDTRIWIDMNNDGSFDASELVATALDQLSPSGMLTIPAGIVFDTPVRVRVQSDVIGQSVGPCDAPLLGQVEDFSAIITQNTAPTVAAFTGSPLTTCDGFVQFTDLSTNDPISWAWDFGDGGTSDEQDPSHFFVADGTYTVTLTAANAFGGSAALHSNYITRMSGWTCDTLEIATMDQMSNVCQGVLADNGGPNAPYLQGTSGSYTITPTGAGTVTLTFSQFQWGNNPNRHLSIYDGPSVASPLIGSATGNGLNMLPNNGVITSSGPAITLRQEQSNFGPPPQTSGFLLTWNCSGVGIEETGAHLIASIRPQPADDRFIVDLVPTSSRTRSLELRDAMGRIVEQRSIAGSATNTYFDVDHLPAGLYVLLVNDADQRAARTLIIR